MCVDVDGDADGDVELGWHRWRWTLFVFLADLLATSNSTRPAQNAPSKHAAPRPHYHSGSYSTSAAHSFLRNCSRTPPLAPPLSVTAALHQLFLQHGSEVSTSTDSDRKRLRAVLCVVFMPTIHSSPNGDEPKWIEPNQNRRQSQSDGHPTAPHPTHPTNQSSCSCSSLGVPCDCLKHHGRGIFLDGVGCPNQAPELQSLVPLL